MIASMSRSHSARKRRRARSLRFGIPGRQRDVEQIRPAEPVAESRDDTAHRRAIRLYLEGEHGAARDFQGQELHGGQKVDGPVRHDREPGQRFVAPVTWLGQKGHHPRGQGRGDDAALQPPGLAFAEEQSLADEGPQDPDGFRERR